VHHQPIFAPDEDDEPFASSESRNRGSYRNDGDADDVTTTTTMTIEDRKFSTDSLLSLAASLHRGLLLPSVAWW
jgi:hypothetical protein